jgi:hypothetical protein
MGIYFTAGGEFWRWSQGYGAISAQGPEVSGPDSLLS